MHSIYFIGALSVNSLESFIIPMEFSLFKGKMAAMQKEIKRPSYRFSHASLAMSGWDFLLVLMLYNHVVGLQAELSYLQAHLATLELPSPPPPPPPPSLLAPTPFSTSDLTSASSLPSTGDLSTMFDPQVQPEWPLQQPQQQRPPTELRPQLSNRERNVLGNPGCGGGDLQALGRELLDRHRSTTSEPPPISKAACLEQALFSLPTHHCCFSTFGGKRKGLLCCSCSFLLSSTDCIVFSIIFVAYFSDSQRYSTTYYLLRSFIVYSCINSKSSIFGYLDEKLVDIGLTKFPGLYPLALSRYLKFTSVFSTSLSPFMTKHSSSMRA
ncbi:hypothetical protein C4D60_Mb05t16230 [Musa balbisiana]|uniref:Uncharacterized protein n=1 Tax=Musa balbisiana TaxID=52838 RepID=A0A4S8JWJ5_MUSBA|nr:hypothetical protein C4D60_Mb05t16230 [Musa balbisiana]